MTAPCTVERVEVVAGADDFVPRPAKPRPRRLRSRARIEQSLQLGPQWAAAQAEVLTEAWDDAASLATALADLDAETTEQRRQDLADLAALDLLDGAPWGSA